MLAASGPERHVAPLWGCGGQDRAATVCCLSTPRGRPRKVDGGVEASRKLRFGSVEAWGGRDSHGLGVCAIGESDAFGATVCFTLVLQNLCRVDVKWRLFPCGTVAITATNTDPPALAVSRSGAPVQSTLRVAAPHCLSSAGSSLPVNQAPHTLVSAHPRSCSVRGAPAPPVCREEDLS